MPTILSSTGVTFPDATIQTTAASASPFVQTYSTNALSGIYATADSTAISATYNNYLIVVQGTINLNSYGGLFLQIGTAGNTWIDSGYSYMVNSGLGTWLTGSSTADVRMSTGPTSGSSYLTSYYPVFIQCWLMNVNEASGNIYKQAVYQMSSGTGNSWSSTMSGGMYNTTTAGQALRGIRFYNGSASWGNGMMRVYGIKNS